MYSTVTEEGQTPRTQITNTSRRWTTCSDQPGDLNVPVHARVFQKKTNLLKIFLCLLTGLRGRKVNERKK